MFSDNRKISSRQTIRLLIYDITGISTLMLPPLLARLTGGDGIFCIFLGLLPAYVFLAIIKNVQKKVNNDYANAVKKTGGFPGSIILAYYYLYSILLAGYVLYTLSILLVRQLLHEESYWLICIFILLLGGYGILGGIEGRARIYEILFWFLMLPLLFMLVLAMKDVNVDYWTPIFSCGWIAFLKGTGIVFLFYMLIYLILFLLPFEQKPGQSVTCAKRALYISAILNASIYLITLGIFGKNTLSQMENPVITLMSMIKLPGGFLERQDVFMVAIWFFTLYALINSSMFYGTECLKKLIPVQGSKRYILVTLILTLLTAGAFYRIPDYIGIYEKFQATIGIPALFLIPLLIAFLKESMNRGKSMQDRADVRKE